MRKRTHVSTSTSGALLAGEPSWLAPWRSVQPSWYVQSAWQDAPAVVDVLPDGAVVAPACFTGVESSKTRSGDFDLDTAAISGEPSLLLSREVGFVTAVGFGSAFVSCGEASRLL